MANQIFSALRHYQKPECRPMEDFAVVLPHRAEDAPLGAQNGIAEKASQQTDLSSPRARAALAQARLIALLDSQETVAAVVAPINANEDDKSAPELVEQTCETPQLAETQSDATGVDHAQSSPQQDDVNDFENHEQAPTTGAVHVTAAQLAELSDGEIDDDDHSDQRFASRRKIKMKAFICISGSQHQTECTVADISSTGVLLQLPIEMHTVSRAGEHVPARFSLFLPTQRTEIDCELAWRSGNRIGARFTSALRQIKADKRTRTKQTPKKTSTAGQIVGKLFSR